MFGALRNRASDAHFLRWYHYRNLPQDLDGSDEEYAIKKDAALHPERPWYKSLLRALLWNIGVFALLALAFWIVHEQPKKRAVFPPTCRALSFVVYLISVADDFSAHDRPKNVSCKRGFHV